MGKTSTTAGTGRRIRGFWSKDRKYEAPDYDNPLNIYFTRWRVIETPWFSFYVHRFQGPDPRTTLHDHAWNSLSIRLRGQMREWVPDDQDVPIKEHTMDGVLIATSVPCHREWVPRFKFRPCHHLHSVDMATDPTWTLFFVGSKQRMWGYMNGDGTYMPFHEHPHAEEHKRAVAERTALIRRGMTVYVEDNDAG